MVVAISLRRFSCERGGGGYWARKDVFIPFGSMTMPTTCTMIPAASLIIHFGIFCSLFSLTVGNSTSTSSINRNYIFRTVH